VALFPDTPLAVGDAAADAYIDKHSKETLLVVDNRLLKAKDKGIETAGDFQPVCSDAETASNFLREQLSMRLFSLNDDRCNILKSRPDTILSMASPGGRRAFQSL